MVDLIFHPQSSTPPSSILNRLVTLVTPSHGKKAKKNFLLDEYKSEIADEVTKAVIHSSFDAYRPTSTRNMFAGLKNLTSIEGMQYLHTDSVTDMSWMFNGCSSLTSLDVSKFNTQNVRDMSYMFYGCSGLTTIYASEQFVTSKVDGDYIFNNCQKLVGAVGYDENKTDCDMASFSGYFTKAIKGDVNNDKRVSIADIAEMIKILNNKGDNHGIYAPVDMNDDGKIDMKDMEDLKKLVGK